MEIISANVDQKAGSIKRSLRTMVRKSRSSISANRKLVKVVFLDGEAVNIETEVSSTEIFRAEQRAYCDFRIKVL